jgi:hypothetical protein
MRAALLAVVLLIAACGQSAPADTATPETAEPAPGSAVTPAFALETEALVGLWSFDRSCGLYDLVFEADDEAQYYDYRDESAVVSYRGTWAPAETNRVELTVRRLDANGAPSGGDITYVLDVSAPVTDDLVGRFVRSDGAEAREINARRCAEEDRD